MLNTTPPLSIRPAPRSAVLCPSRRGTTPTTDASSGERPGTAIDPRWARAGSPLTPGGGLAGGGGSSGGEDGMSLSTTSRPPSASAGGLHGSPRAMPLGMPSPSSELSLAPPYESLSGEELATMACEREREQEPNHMTGRYGRYPRFAALTQPYTAPADVPNGDTPSGVRDESLVISPPSRSSLFLSDGDGLPPILPTAAQPQPVPPIMMPSNNVRRNALIARSTRPRRYPKPSPLVHVTVQHIYKDVGHNNPTANVLPQPYNPTSSTSSSRGDQSGRGESSCGSSEERERPPRDSPRRPARGGGALVMLRFSDDSSAAPPPRSTADAVCRPSILAHPTAPSIQFTPVASTEKYAAPNDEQADQHRRSYPMMHHQSTRCHSLRHALSWWWWSIWQLLWYINIVLLTFLVLGCGVESMIFHRQP